MGFPLSLPDIILWLAGIAIILLSTSELLSPYYGKNGILIEKRRLRIMALAVSLLFILAFSIEIYQMIAS